MLYIVTGLQQYRKKTSLPSRSKSTNEQIIVDQSVLNDKLNNIIIPYEVVLCNDKMCKAHHSEICEYHDAVIMSMIDACRETIPTPKQLINVKLYLSGMIMLKATLILHCSGIICGLKMISLTMVLLKF